MIYIGIDPGVNTGVAVWDSSSRIFRSISTGTILDAFFLVKLARVQFADDNPANVHIIFEDARKRKWIPREKSLSQFKGRAMGAGSVKRDCEIWEEFCKREGFEYTAIPPRAGATKWSAEQFGRVTGWKGRTSNHARDAAMLVFGK